MTNIAGQRRRRNVWSFAGFLACATGADAQSVSEVPAPLIGPPQQVEPPPKDNPPADPAPEATNTVAFQPSFFNEFRPQTAQDMINRLPGFSFDGGDSGVRGLAGASGNVLIDGQRPVTKSLGLADVIRRIPARAVLRIDLIRGGAPGVDMQGQSLVANIIRDPRGFSSVTAEFLTKFYDGREPAVGPRLEASWTRGDWSISGAAAYRNEREQNNAGDGRIVRDNFLTGIGRSAGRYRADWDREDANANMTVEYRNGADLVRLNLSGGREVVDRRDGVSLVSPSGDISQELVAAREVENAGEASIDYERAFSSTVIGRAMLLQRLEEEVTDSTSIGRGLPQQSRDRGLAGETIGRLALTVVPAGAVTIDVSAEGSYNFLDASSQLRRDGVPIALPSANVKVTERRGNFTAFARWQAARWASLEVGSGYELSRIAQSGDVSQSKNLNFWKPRAIATIDPAENWQLRLRTERLVDQLDFEDFAASVSLEPGGSNAGNPDLVPETSWIVEAAIERRFWGRGAITLTANRSWISNAIDLVPIDNEFDAPGNIGNGWRREFRASLTLPTERFGVPGGQIRFNGTWRRSRVIDPTTGVRRRISQERPFSGDITITKDFPALNSVIGMEIYSGLVERANRLFEIRYERSSAEPLTKIYWDWVPSSRTSLRFQIENFEGRVRSRERFLFAGPRSAGVLANYEKRTAKLDPFIMIRLRQQF